MKHEKSFKCRYRDPNVKLDKNKSESDSTGNYNPDQTPQPKPATNIGD